MIIWRIAAAVAAAAALDVVIWAESFAARWAAPEDSAVVGGAAVATHASKVAGAVPTAGGHYCVRLSDLKKAQRKVHYLICRVEARAKIEKQKK